MPTVACPSCRQGTLIVYRLFVSLAVVLPLGCSESTAPPVAPVAAAKPAKPPVSTPTPQAVYKAAAATWTDEAKTVARALEDYPFNLPLLKRKTLALEDLYTRIPDPPSGGEVVAALIQAARTEISAANHVIQTTVESMNRAGVAPRREDFGPIGDFVKEIKKYLGQIEAELAKV